MVAIYGQTCAFIGDESGLKTAQEWIKAALARNGKRDKNAFQNYEVTTFADRCGLLSVIRGRASYLSASEVIGPNTNNLSDNPSFCISQTSAEKMDTQPIERAFHRLRNAKARYEFIINCSHETQEHLIGNISAFKHLEELFSESYFIKKIRKLSESDGIVFDDLSPDYPESVLKNAMVVEVNSKENKDESMLPYFVFVCQEGEWKYDMIISAGIGLTKSVEEILD